MLTSCVNDQIYRQTGVASSNQLVCGIEFFPSRIVLAHCIDELNQQLLILLWSNIHVQYSVYTVALMDVR